MIRRRRRRWTLRLALWSTGLLLAAVLGYTGWHGAQILWWRSHNPSQTAFMAQRLEAMAAKDPKAALRQIWVPYEQISGQLKRAVVAAEDARFLQHSGFDWEGIQNALERNMREKEFVAGGSTISQQLAKNLFLSGERTLLRKAQEAYLTLLIEAFLDKRRILDIYLNVAEWGNGVFGAEAAARHHFGVSAARLDRRQAALLAVMLPNPRYYDRRGTTRALQRRADVIRSHLRWARIP